MLFSSAPRRAKKSQASSTTGYPVVAMLSMWPSAHFSGISLPLAACTWTSLAVHKVEISELPLAFQFLRNSQRCALCIPTRSWRLLRGPKFREQETAPLAPTAVASVSSLAGPGPSTAADVRNPTGSSILRWPCTFRAQEFTIRF